jgi:hypothetical protein
VARPSEIKAVRQYLEHGIHLEQKDDESEEQYRERYLNEGAKSIIRAVDEARMDRTDYVVVSQLGRLVQGYGFFATYKQAATAIEKQNIWAVDGARFFVIPVVHPKAHELQQQAADAPALSEEAQRIWQIARNGGSPARSATRRKRRRAS